MKTRSLTIAILALITAHVALSQDVGRSIASTRKCDQALSKKKKPQLVTLFSGEEPVKNYNNIIDKINDGDDLRFGHGETFHVVKELGEGGTTLIFDIGNDEALRVPVFHTTHVLDPKIFEFIEDFQIMQPELLANGVAVIEMKPEKNIPKQAVVVKKEPFQFTLEDYFKQIDRNGNALDLSKKEKEKIESRLAEFAKTTWMYDMIGDFRPSEMGYNGERWILFDFGANGAFKSVLIKNLDSEKTIFSYFLNEARKAKFPKVRYTAGPEFIKFLKEIRDDKIKENDQLLSILPDLEKVILKERKKQKKDPSLFNKILSRGTFTRS